MILSAPDPALDGAFAAALLRLQHDAYRSQAEIIGDDRLAALTADVDSLPAWRGRYLVAWEGTTLLGAIAWRPGSVTEVDRLMVDPTARRRRVAHALLSVILDGVAGPVETFTGRNNTPGISLYCHFGFEPIADEESSTGIAITRLRRG